MATDIRWKYDIYALADRAPGVKKWHVAERPAFPSKRRLFSSDSVEECKDWIEEKEREGGYAK